MTGHLEVTGKGARANPSGKFVPSGSRPGSVTVWDADCNWWGSSQGGIWERHLGEASERGIWERHLREASERGI